MIQGQNNCFDFHRHHVARDENMMHSELFKRKNYSVQLNRCINIFHKLSQNFCAGNGCNDQGSLRSGVEACNDGGGQRDEQ